MRFKSTIVAATAVALAAAGGTAIADNDRDGRDDGDRYSQDYDFATIKDGTKLVVFDDNDAKSYNIRGLLPGETVVGLDVRPTDSNNNGFRDEGELYGIGKVGTTGYVFELEINRGRAEIDDRRTLEQDPAMTGAGGAFSALRGSFFGVDFNPSVDRLRITSDEEQNLRVNVDTGATIADGNLAYPTGDRRNTATPAPNVIDPSVVGAGYTYAPLMGPTTLYDVDTANPDFFVLQNPPNGGALNSLGPIGVDAGGKAGFDIAGKETFQAFELAQVGDRAKLYVLRFDRNGKASDTGISLRGDYDGLAVLDGYRR